MKDLQKNFPMIRKAIASFLVGLGGFLAVTLPLVTDGNISNSDIIAIIGALTAWLGGTAAVYQVPNESMKEKKA